MKPSAPLSRQLPLGVRWRDNSSFDTFVAGDNALAIEHLKAAGSGAPVVTWIWGSPGTGRTHLLQAACAHAGQHGLRTSFFPLRERAAFGVEALEGCEGLDLVCIDDVEQVAGEPAWERGLFNLYNGLQETGGRMAVASEHAPAGVRWALADLQSRMAAGLAVQLKPLDEEGRTQVLRWRARNRGLELPDETAAFLLRRYPRDLTSLCRLLDTLDTASLAAQRRLTVPFIKSAIDATGGTC